MLAADPRWTERVSKIERSTFRAARASVASVSWWLSRTIGCSNLRLAIVQWSTHYEVPYPITRQSLRTLRGEYAVVPSPESTA
jgi:hypothetical protein